VSLSANVAGAGGAALSTSVFSRGDRARRGRSSASGSSRPYRYSGERPSAPRQRPYEETIRAAAAGRATSTSSADLSRAPKRSSSMSLRGRYAAHRPEKRPNERAELWEERHEHGESTVATRSVAGRRRMSAPPRFARADRCERSRGLMRRSARPRAPAPAQPRDWTPGARRSSRPGWSSSRSAFNSVGVGNAPIRRVWDRANWQKARLESRQVGNISSSADVTGKRSGSYSGRRRVTTVPKESDNKNGNSFDHQGRQLSLPGFCFRLVGAGSMRPMDSDRGFSLTCKRLNCPNGHRAASRRARYGSPDPTYGGR